MSDHCVHFHLRDFVQKPEVYHFASVDLAPGNHASYHDHDYHEIFWVTHGRGRHRWNGHTEELRAHQLYLIRPEDRHCVSTEDGTEPMGIVNVAFPSSAWRQVRQRFFGTEADPFAADERGRTFALDTRARESLAFWTGRLDRPDRPSVALVGFLMDLPQFTQALQVAAGVPDWLERACEEIRQPEHFQEGTARFVRLAGRTSSHVARESRRWLGQTPSEIVNAARMDFAARQLTTTSRQILDIALDCGLANLSHFYAQFRQAHGTSPRRYRLQAKSPVKGPNRPAALTVR